MKKSFIITSMAAFAALCLTLTAQAQGPVVVSDKDDYSPGETALFQAAGFQPNELLDFSVAVGGDDGTWVPDIAWADVPADASGGAEVDYIVPEGWLGKTLQLTVMGLTSGLVAQTTFTDAVHPVVTVSASPTPPVADGTHVLLTAALSASPAPTPNCGKMQVQLSTDGGTNWTTVVEACAPDSVVYDYDTTGHCSDSPAPQFRANFAPGGGSTCTNCGGSFSGANSDPLTITITCPAGTPTPTPTPTATACANNPPVITCASPTPNADLGQVVGCLGVGTGFGQTFPVTYSIDGQDTTAATVKAHITKPDSSVVDATVATVTDPDGNTVHVTLSNGTTPLTINGPGSGSASFSVDIHADDGQSCNNTADSNCGGEATAQIVYGFNGFFPPLSNVATTKVKQGSAVPVKFQLTDCSGTLITPANMPGDGSAPMVNVVYVSGVTPSGTPSVDDAGNSNGDTDFARWDPTGLQWIFNLKTNSSYAVGATYGIQVLPNDGSTHTADISIK